MYCGWLWIVFAILIVFFILWLLTRPNNTVVVTERRFTTQITSSQEVPPNLSSGVGNGTVVLAGNREYLDYTFAVNNLSTPAIAAHFHRGAVGVNGPIVKILNLESLGENRYRLIGRWSKKDVNQPLTDDLINDLLNGRIYINIHTTRYPDGEVRGQIVNVLTN